MISHKMNKHIILRILFFPKAQPINRLTQDSESLVFKNVLSSYSIMFAEMEDCVHDTGSVMSPGGRCDASNVLF